MDVTSKNASLLYNSARNLVSDAMPAEKPKKPEQSFAQTMTEAANETVSSLKKAEDTAMAGMQGSADPQSVVEAMLEAEMAIETAVAVRDKVVEAYQEILRMPV